MQSSSSSSSLPSLLDEFGITIDEKLKQQLLGRQTLTVFKENEIDKQAIGGMCIDIRQGQSAQENNFLICVTAKFRIDENSVGISKSLSWVDGCLNLIEEKRTEILKLKTGDTTTKEIYVAKMNDGGLFSSTKTATYRYPGAAVKNFICEGANILLLKCLAILGISSFKERATTAMTIDAHLCDNLYVGGEEVVTTPDQLFVARAVIKPTGQKSISYARVDMNEMSLGKIRELKWLDNNILVMSSLVHETNKYVDQIASYSRRLSDKKAEFKFEISNKPTLTATLDDYVQELLLNKPECILEFTSSFFARLKQLKK